MQDQQLTRLLHETVAWCCPRFSMFDLRGSLRQLPAPGIPLDQPGSLEKAVAKLQESRREALGAEVSRRRGMCGGRVLIALPAITLLHGFSEDETGGFLDESDVPPHDTWIAAEGPLLAAWIPANMVSAVNIAVEVNAEGCIRWAEDGEDELSKKLLRVGLQS